MRKPLPRVIVGWRAMAFVTVDGVRRPVIKSRIYGAKQTAQDYADELRKSGADEPYIQAVERIERKEPDIT